MSKRIWLAGCVGVLLLAGCKKPVIDERSKVQGLNEEVPTTTDTLDQVDDGLGLVALPSHCLMEKVEDKDCLVCSPRAFKLRECFVAPADFDMAKDCKLSGTTDADQKVVCEKDGKKISELSFKKRSVEEAADSVGFVSAMARVVVSTKVPTEKPEKAMGLELIDVFDENLKPFMQGDSEIDALLASVETVVLKHKPQYAGEKMSKVKSSLKKGLEEIQALIKKDSVNMMSLIGLYAKLGGELPSGDAASQLFSLDDLTKLLSAADDKTLDMIREQLKN